DAGTGAGAGAGPGAAAAGSGGVGDAAALLGVPEQLRRRWDLASAHQVRHLHVARTAQGVVGVALAVHRPLTAYEKVAGLWVGPDLADAAGITHALIASVVEHARQAGAVAVKIELDPRAVVDPADVSRAALAA